MQDTLIKLPTKLLIIPVLLIAFFLSIFFLDIVNMSFLRGEYGAIELLSAFFYLCSVVLCIYGLISKKSEYTPYLVLWLICTFFFFGEETSWLQHIIGYNTPEKILAINAQSEFNLHNLKWFQGGGITRQSNPDGGFPNLLASQNLFRMGFFTYFLIFPIIGLLKIDKGLFSKIRFPFPGHRFMLYIWAPIGVSLVLAIFSYGDVKDVIAETRELYYAISIFTYVALIIFQVKKVPIIKTSEYHRAAFSGSKPHLNP